MCLAGTTAGRGQEARSMKLNRAERLTVNSPLRVLVQKRFLMPWIQQVMALPGAVNV